MVRLKIALLLFVLCFAASFGYAQDTGSPLYVLYAGDLWEWNPDTGVREQLTTWGYNSDLVLSPDGEKIAYLSIAREAIEGDYVPEAGAPPNNIWILDRNTQESGALGSNSSSDGYEFTRIAQQDVYPSMRSRVSWSPDGTQLAWSEVVDAKNNRARLVIYDFNTQALRVLDDSFELGYQDGGLYLPSVQWGPGGIAHIYFTIAASGDGQSILHLYHPNNDSMTSTLLASSPNPFSGDGTWISDYFWVEHQAKAMLALRDSNSTWSVYDPFTDTRSELSQPPQMVLRNGNGYALVPMAYDEYGGLSWNLSQQESLTNLGIVSYGISPSSTPTFSPDGAWIAWQDEGQVNAARLNSELGTPIFKASPDSGIVNVVWGPVRWITSGKTGSAIVSPSTGTSTGSSSSNGCALASRLRVGQSAYVKAGPPNNIREQPSTSGAFLGTIDAGTVIQLAEGPICADGYNWWRYDTSAGSFWTAEGGDTLYWLEPHQDHGCRRPPHVYFNPGATGYVLPGDANALRNSPGTATSSVIARIPADANFTVLGNAICGDDLRWWLPVDYQWIIGWTADGDDLTQWVAPR